MKFIRWCGPALTALGLVLALSVMPRTGIADDEIVQILQPPSSEAGDPDQPDGHGLVYIARLWVWSSIEGGRLFVAVIPLNAPAVHHCPSHVTRR